MWYITRVAEHVLQWSVWYSLQKGPCSTLHWGFLYVPLKLVAWQNIHPQHKYKITLLFMELEEQPLPKHTWEAGRQWCEQVAEARWSLCGRAQRPRHSDKKGEEQKGLGKEGWQRKCCFCRGLCTWNCYPVLGKRRREMHCWTCSGNGNKESGLSNEKENTTEFINTGFWKLVCWAYLRTKYRGKAQPFPQ